MCKFKNKLVFFFLDFVSISRFFRIEEIPKDEINLLDDEMLICVVHFEQNLYNVFGIPFMIKVKNGELFGSLKERMQKKLGVLSKEWETVYRKSF